MKKFKCLHCGHVFEVESISPGLKCPKCLNRFVELVEGEPIKGKSWSSKSFSVPKIK
ncbi:hydrogenase expression protein HypA/HybF [Thermovirga sp.]|uniref:hydrogenase expression protein HypA/HybF n=1 Tax=Thermovirga sp. TaxID=2699834 RepID=UPI0025CE8EB3|nr:hydrogenase expression protein HypA/HybF [Thermovirga sp.]MBO8153463.1 hydrogenase expression protein HypA/HybF [Thermovirga sp.]